MFDDSFMNKLPSGIGRERLDDTATLNPHLKPKSL